MTWSIPTVCRDELGGPDAFNALVDAAHTAGVGIVLDIVPHHMAAAADNAWWWSVLELGRDSPYASHFDIDWDPPERRLRGTILLPVLGDHYGRVLEAGELHLARDPHDRLVVRYYEHVAPLSPDTADEVWAEAGRRGCAVDVVLDEVNQDIDRLDSILERQHHRFARWQAAAHELDYRRFFDVDSLVALRTERPAVFDDTHRLTGALVGEGKVDGLRVDHVDGLRDPEAYLSRLRAIAPDAWIVVEKILCPPESTPDSWAVDGTTGYDFLAMAAAVLVDAAGVERLVEGYARVTGDASTYAETRVVARREALRDSLDADLERVVAMLMRVCERNRRWRDFTRSELRDVVTEVCVHASAYRSYARPGTEPTQSDRDFVERAIAGAVDDRPDLDPDLLDLVRQLLLGKLTGDDESTVMARFQQLTGPVAAKGEEDTAFYRWVPLLCLNEVGAEPDEPAITVEQFHARCVDVQRRWPLTMLTTSTHDTKRSEDVRARLAVLSEVDAEWIATVDRWCDENDRYRDVELDAPNRRDEWFIYQTLVGAHPVPVERAWPVIEKSFREAKLRTDWVRVDDEYESATRRFVESILADERFVADLDRVVGSLEEPGQVNALTQLALRLLCPGVPDTYQGSELWDLSLVDPDNRRPVDYGERAKALSAIEHLERGGAVGRPPGRRLAQAGAASRLPQTPGPAARCLRSWRRVRAHPGDGRGRRPRHRLRARWEGSGDCPPPAGVRSSGRRRHHLAGRRLDQRAHGRPPLRRRRVRQALRRLPRRRPRGRSPASRLTWRRAHTSNACAWRRARRLLGRGRLPRARHRRRCGPPVPANARLAARAPRAAPDARSTAHPNARVPPAKADRRRRTTPAGHERCGESCCRTWRRGGGAARRCQRHT